MIIKSPQALPALDSAPVVGRKLITQVTSCKRPMKVRVFAGDHATAAPKARPRVALGVRETAKACKNLAVSIDEKYSAKALRASPA